MIYAICIIVSLFMGFIFGAQVALYAVEKRALQIGSDLLLKTVRSITKPDKKDCWHDSYIFILRGFNKCLSAF